MSHFRWNDPEMYNSNMNATKQKFTFYAIFYIFSQL